MRMYCTATLLGCWYRCSYSERFLTDFTSGCELASSGHIINLCSRVFNDKRVERVGLRHCENKEYTQCRPKAHNGPMTSIGMETSEHKECSQDRMYGSSKTASHTTPCTGATGLNLHLQCSGVVLSSYNNGRWITMCVFKPLAMFTDLARRNCRKYGSYIRITALTDSWNTCSVEKKAVI